MTEKIDSRAEKAIVEQVIKNSIRWAVNKDKELLYKSFVNDSTLFYFSPDNAGTISGFAAFQELVDNLFMNPAFKAIKAEFIEDGHGLRIKASDLADGHLFGNHGCPLFSVMYSDFTFHGF